jgi:hypothetical protein
MDPDPDPAIFAIGLQDANKKLIFKKSLSAYYFLNVGGSEELLLDFPWSELLLVFASRQCLLLLYGSKVRREDRQGSTLLSLAKRRPIRTIAREGARMARPQQSGVGVGRIRHGYVPADRAAGRRGWAKVKASYLRRQSSCGLRIKCPYSGHRP